MEPHVINLIYNAVDRTVTGQRVMRPIKIGDTLIFQSADGPVHVKIYPEDVFSAAEYQSGQPPLLVKKRAKFQYWCGVTINGQVVGFPLNKQFGATEDTTNP